jgi:hypothetical protein
MQVQAMWGGLDVTAMEFIPTPAGDIIGQEEFTVVHLPLSGSLRCNCSSVSMVQALMLVWQLEVRFGRRVRCST